MSSIRLSIRKNKPPHIERETMNRSLAYQNHQRLSVFKTAPLFFKVAFIATFSIILVGFIFTAVMVAQILLGGGGYSYKVDYQVGNSHYSEESSWGK